MSRVLLFADMFGSGMLTHCASCNCTTIDYFQCFTIYFRFSDYRLKFRKKGGTIARDFALYHDVITGGGKISRRTWKK